MDFFLKEPLSVYQNGNMYSIRTQTKGVEQLGQVLFFDVTKSVAISFAKDFCLENTSMFQVNRLISDKEVSLRDVLKVIAETTLSDNKKQELFLKLNSL